MEILSNKDLRECTQYLATQLMRTIGMMEIMIATTENTKTVECLKILQSRLKDLHNDTQTLDKRLDI